MDTKPDGRLYSRVLRRIVAIVQSLAQNKELTIGEMAENIHNRNLPEFYLKRFDRSISARRIADYIRYLRDIKVLVPREHKFVLNFSERATDLEWAQAMSDRALEHLAQILKKNPDKVSDFLEAIRKRLFRSRRVPTLDAISSDLEMEGGRQQELFRWSIYVYTDGPTCLFDVRRHPVLSSRT